MKGGGNTEMGISIFTSIIMLLGLILMISTDKNAIKGGLGLMFFSFSFGIIYNFILLYLMIMNYNNIYLILFTLITGLVILVNIIIADIMYYNLRYVSNISRGGSLSLMIIIPFIIVSIITVISYNLE